MLLSVHPGGEEKSANYGEGQSASLLADATVIPGPLPGDSPGPVAFVVPAGESYRCHSLFAELPGLGVVINILSLWEVGEIEKGEVITHISVC